MLLKNLKEKILNNVFAKKFYVTMFYFEQGKGQVNRFYNEIPQFIIILGGLKYLFNISFTPLVYVLIFVAGFLCFTLFGYFVKNTGLWDVDKIVCATKDPVQGEIYKAALKINGGK